MKSFLQKKKINIIIWLGILFFSILTGVAFFNYLYKMLLILLIIIALLYMIIERFPKHVQNLIATALIYIIFCIITICILSFLRELLGLPYSYNYFITNFILSVGLLAFPIDEMFTKKNK